jgi:hypothetical protein
MSSAVIHSTFGRSADWTDADRMRIRKGMSARIVEAKHAPVQGTTTGWIAAGVCPPPQSSFDERADCFATLARSCCDMASDCSKS